MFGDKSRKELMKWCRIAAKEIFNFHRIIIPEKRKMRGLMGRKEKGAC